MVLILVPGQNFCDMLTTEMFAPSKQIPPKDDTNCSLSQVSSILHDKNCFHVCNLYTMYFQYRGHAD